MSEKAAKKATVERVVKLAKGEVEIKPRNGALQSVKIEEAVSAVLKLVDAGNVV